MILGNCLSGVITSNNTNVSWWQAGGASGAVAVYQPKGAASLAASYADLSGSGNNAAPGVAPTWSSSDGWSFNGSTQYLDSGVSPSSGWSMIVCITGATKSPDRLAGVFSSTANAFAIQSSNGSGTNSYYYSGSGGGGGASPRATSGILAIAGAKAYRDGVDESLSLSGTISGLGSIYVGDIRGSSNNYAGNIQAFAIYNNTLSASEVAAVTTAMQAL